MVVIDNKGRGVSLLDLNVSKYTKIKNISINRPLSIFVQNLFLLNLCFNNKIMYVQRYKIKKKNYIVLVLLIRGLKYFFC